MAVPFKASDSHTLLIYVRRNCCLYPPFGTNKPRRASQDSSREGLVVSISTSPARYPGLARSHCARASFSYSAPTKAIEWREFLSQAEQVLSVRMPRTFCSLQDI